MAPTGSRSDNNPAAYEWLLSSGAAARMSEWGRCRLRVSLRDCWTAQVRGDIGGFDIGEASRFTWNIEATLEYRTSQRCSLFADYRWLDIDHTSGSDDRTFVDMNLNGPLVGIALDF